jgi:hypothetical protein
MARYRSRRGVPRSQNRRPWLPLREKGGKRHVMPATTISKNSSAYLDGAGLHDDPKGRLFRTIGGGMRRPTRAVLLYFRRRTPLR